MKKEVKEFLKDIACGFLENADVKAEKLLKEEFRYEVIETFNYFLRQKPIINSIKEKNKAKFVTELAYSKGDFFNENWDRMDEIMAILKEEIEKPKSDEE